MPYFLNTFPDTNLERVVQEIIRIGGYVRVMNAAVSH